MSEPLADRVMRGIAAAALLLPAACTTGRQGTMDEDITTEAAATTAAPDAGMAGPASFGAGAGHELDGTSWRLVRLDGRTLDPDLPEITLAFEGGKAAGSGGCNWYTVWIEKVEAGELEVGPIAATRMACVHPRIMEREAGYLAGVEEVTTYELAENRLVLRYGSGEGSGTLEFEPS